MSHKRVDFGLVVELDLDSYLYFNNEDQARERMAKEAAEPIRHMHNVADVRVTWRTVCEFCNDTWDWDNPPYCCNKAQDEWVAKHPEWSLDEEGNWHKAATDES